MARSLSGSFNCTTRTCLPDLLYEMCPILATVSMLCTSTLQLPAIVLILCTHEIVAGPLKHADVVSGRHETPISHAFSKSHHFLGPDLISGHGFLLVGGLLVCSVLMPLPDVPVPGKQHG